MKTKVNTEIFTADIANLANKLALDIEQFDKKPQYGSGAFLVM